MASCRYVTGTFDKVATFGHEVEPVTETPKTRGDVDLFLAGYTDDHGPGALRPSPSLRDGCTAM